MKDPTLSVVAAREHSLGILEEEGATLEQFMTEVGRYALVAAVQGDAERAALCAGLLEGFGAALKGGGGGEAVGPDQRLQALLAQSRAEREEAEE